MTPSPWPSRGLALVAGSLAALAFPPFGLLPGLLGYGLLLWLLGREPLLARRAFLYGWLAGLGYFSVGVWWVTEAFLVEAEVHGWMAPFALAFLAGGLALFWGLATAVFAKINRGGWSQIFLFVALLSSCEWLRGHLLSGFPWNLPGESWATGSAPSQLASVIGAYGLSYVTIALGAAPALWPDLRTRRAKAILLVGLLATLSGLYGWGAYRLSRAPTPSSTAPWVRLVQANIDQKEKWRPENLQSILTAYLTLSAGSGGRRPDLIIWPEGALPAVIDDLIYPGSPFLAHLNKTLAPGQTLMMGTTRMSPTLEGGYLYYNSLVALRRDLGAPMDGFRVTGVYDKHQLVPFGEFLPLSPLATKLGLRALVHMPQDFTPGSAPAPITPMGVPPVQPLICYEALFPSLSGKIGVRPAWMLNISNDAWFGATSGPWQHLNIAGYRAIETGLPLARATPTGVTTMIDAFGRPGARLGLGQMGVIDAQLPPALPQTPYARWGDLSLALMILAGSSPPCPGEGSEKPG
ncbi:MAG: apolipoprotein N-acyltransferase [Phenylobacterium zucineum]|nr:MAG: apolipoprotein N-acyltransferase [Phenylobacterium zucineum]